jgi:hypothetical protein
MPPLCAPPRSLRLCDYLLIFCEVYRPKFWKNKHQLTTFRINTRKSVSKQGTLTHFRINTYAKPGEGGL